MKSLAIVLSLLLMGISASAWAQGGSAANGKALVDSNKCALCHKAGSKLGKPMEQLASGGDARIKGSHHRPQGDPRARRKNAGLKVMRCSTE